MLHSEAPLNFLSAPGFAGSNHERIAYKKSDGQNQTTSPTFIWCGGLRSDMEGGKATHLHDWAIREGHAYIRFDYYGHGESSGDFEKGTISRWAQDTVQVMDELTEGPVALVGSSMGGWASLLAALQRPTRVKGLLLIAPAPDFTEKLMWASFSADIQNEIMEKGVYYEPSDYGDPMPISRVLIEDGGNNLLMDGPITFAGPVRILQGMCDPDVPYAHAQKLVECLTGEDVEITLVKSGDHRLSTEADLDRLVTAAENLCAIL